MKTFFYIFLASFLIFVGVLLVKTLIYRSVQKKVELEEIPELSKASIAHFSEAITIKTISYDNKDADTSEFVKFHSFLKRAYPLVDSILVKKYINHLGLLYKWKGKDESLKPILLLAHLDVVPVNQADWQNPPFSGLIKDSVIWGRGTLDDKISVISIMEAVELLLHQKFQPNQTIYLAFGQDEEKSGKYGAVAISKYLKENNIDPLFIIDEGLVVTDNIIPNLKQPAALIGIAEKGYLTLELKVKYSGGHSSMPESETAISILANAIGKLEKNPMPLQITPPVEEFLNHIGPEIPFPMKIVFANRWLFNPLIKSTYGKTGQGRALVSNTIAPTIFEAGVKENVIPSEARAVINFRTLPGTTSQVIIDYITKNIDDNRVEIIEHPWKHAPSEVAGINTKGYQLIEKSIKQVFPNTIVAPSLVLATTDSRHYQPISSTIYRFLPIQLKQDDLKCIHGDNEHITFENYRRAIGFYHQLLKNCND